MSTPPRRPFQPSSLTRTSYQVGRPWMLLGKMLRGLTGTPMRRMALANSSLAEAEDGLGEQSGGGGGAGAVDVGELDDEVVDGGDRVHAATSFPCARAEPASAVLNSDFCMSQAPVGQRSAHSPQCRQTSSSFT